MPAFKKQHYETVVQVLRSTMPGFGFAEAADNPKMAQWERDCLAFMNHFRQDNPQFDGERFLLACKGEKHGNRRR